MNPIIYCDNPTETLYNTTNSLNKKLEKTTNKQIIDNYENIHKLDINQDNSNLNLLYEALYNELNHITLYKHREGCEITTILITTNIEGILISLIKLNKLDIFTPDELSKFVYQNLLYQLYNKTNGILNNIFHKEDDITESESEDSLNTTTSDDSE